MIIVVSGSRGWTDKERIRQRLLHYRPDLVVQGGAGGADELTKEICEEELIDCRTERAKWRTYGKAAGHKRNKDMLDIYRPDLVLAFWDGSSPGTKGMIDTAGRLGYKLDVQLEFSHE